jgi:predicted amidohydrolase YtcJ
LISDWRAADRHWGDHRARNTYAFRSLLDHGAVLACGSDAPVEPCDPRLGFFAATERQDLGSEPEGGWYPRERISMLEVLRGYTTSPALASGTSDCQGVLAPGAYADIAVWDRDPLTLRGPELLELEVRATIAGGHVIQPQVA